MFVLVGDSAEAVASSYVEVGDGVRVGDRCGERLQQAGVCDALVGPVGVVVLFELAQGVEQVAKILITEPNASRRPAHVTACAACGSADGGCAAAAPRDLTL
ncbi:hypothetical protein ACFC09_43790 [Streptomyces sp. NPDC056161]|uniref:hypothetical protein n=1 Tax=Streptomyces sp. NPDC056161 TaxID=3345732 RepID=UPI0035DB3627